MITYINKIHKIKLELFNQIIKETIVVIPAYNAENTINNVVAETLKTGFENIIISDDCTINSSYDLSKYLSEKVIFINKGLLSREEIVGLIKRNSIIDIGKIKEKADKYSLMSILVFNINIEPENLKTFFKNNKTKDKSGKDPCIGSQFLNSIKTIDTIVFDKSISMFHDINNLYLVFAKKSELKKRAATKRRALSSFAKTKRRQEKTI